MPGLFYFNSNEAIEIREGDLVSASCYVIGISVREGQFGIVKEIIIVNQVIDSMILVNWFDAIAPIWMFPKELNFIRHNSEKLLGYKYVW